jgi:aspartyl protease
MPHLTLPLSPEGCVVGLYVGVSAPRAEALAKASLPVPQAVQMRALIDTGATGTVIHAPLVKPLGLTPTGTVPVHTPSTAGKALPCLQYDVLLAIFHPKGSLVLGTMPVIAADLTGTGTEGLIGRDVLGGCLFIYDGVASQFSLAF